MDAVLTKDRFLIQLEVFVPSFLFLVMLFYYVAFANIAGDHHVDYSHYFSTSWDREIPLVPYFIFPYIPLTIINPFLAMFALIRANGFDPGLFRRYYACLLMAMVCVFVVFYFFPVYYRDYSLVQMPHDGVFSMAVALTHAHESAWNSFPSMHVILPWYFFRVTQNRAGNIAWLFFIFSVLISLSTLFIKIHYIADVIGAYVMGELAYRLFVFTEKKNFFSEASSKKVLSYYTFFGLIFLMGLLALSKAGFVTF